MTTEEAAEERTNAPARPSWLPFVAPMAVFMLFTALEGQAPRYYPILYILKAAVTTGALLLFRRPLRDIKPEARTVLPAVLVGAAVFVEWIWLEPLTHYPHFGFMGKQRAEYNPFQSIADPAMRTAFLAVRFYGLALLVPFVEEIFWRSFMLRIFTDPDDFARVGIGSYSWGAFAIVAAAFGLAHPEWLEAVICAAAYALLLRRTRSLFACIVAHSITNLMLGIYVVTQHAWKFW